MLYNRDLQFEMTSRIEPDGYIVDLKTRTCASRALDLSGIPCAHACAAMFYMRYNLANHVLDWFRVQTYMRAYLEILRVVRGERFWPRVTVTPPLPPPLKTPIGRPQKMRRRQIH